MHLKSWEPDLVDSGEILKLYVLVQSCSLVFPVMGLLTHLEYILIRIREISQAFSPASNSATLFPSSICFDLSLKFDSAFKACSNFSIFLFSYEISVDLLERLHVDASDLLDLTDRLP